MIIVGFLSLVLLIANFGFYLPEKMVSASVVVLYVLAAGSCVWEGYKTKLSFKSWYSFFVHHWFEALTAIYLVGYILIPQPFVSFWQFVWPDLSSQEVTIASLGTPLSMVFFVRSVGWIRVLIKKTKIALRPPQIFILSFMAPIVIGTLLLSLPKSLVVPISWLDALFMATSAICVTGLAVVDVSQVFSPMGKTLIAILIQIGGLGIMTLTITFATFFSGGIGIRERILMSDLLSEERVGEVKGLLLKICFFTFTIEILGGFGLYWASGNSIAQFDHSAFYVGLFHSISAFCNAGFSLLSQGLYDPSLRMNYAFGSVIMVLIILGGLGFPVLANLFDLGSSWYRKKSSGRMTTSSKMALLMTAILLPLGLAVIYLIERNHSFSELPIFDQIFQSLFLSVTTRTAGFNLWPTEALSVQTGLVLIVLMWIGGSPMSTAGGVKTVTILVAALNIRSQALGVSRVEIFGRQIRPASIQRAFSALAISVLLILFGSVLMMVFEPQVKPIDGVFEVVSAIGTVGLSRGATGTLSVTGKSLLIFLMFAGRIGAITILSALFAPLKSEKYKYLEDSVIVY